MADYLSRLKTALASNSVVVVAGTGVSMSSSKSDPSADWIGLLRSGIERVVELDRTAGTWADLQGTTLDMGIDQNDVALLIGVASQISSRLDSHGPQAKADWLRDTVGSLEVRNRTVPDAIASLRAPILTTNYDRLLERALRRSTVDWRDQEGMREIFRSDSDAIGHLHGDWQAPDSVILTGEDYASLLYHEPSQFLESAHYSTKSFLYLGYGSGLNDPNFAHLLKWHRKLFPQSRGDHYRLCLERDFDRLTAEHAGDDIRIISYGEDYDDLAPFLESLRQDDQGSHGLGRDAIAFAREALVDQIRTETVFGDKVADVDDRGLNDLIVEPVVLPMPHEQFVHERSIDTGIKPERIDPHTLYASDKLLIVAGEELSGVTTALRWLASHAAASRERTAPMFVDARNCVISLRPLERQVRGEALRHQLIRGKKDPLPSYVLALDNLKPQTSKEYQHLLEDIAANDSQMMIVGCREGDEPQLVEDLRSVGRSIEIVYLGKLGRGEVRRFAEILAPRNPVAICDGVMKIVSTERLPRSPFTVALLVVLLSQVSGASAAINNSETSVLEQYVNLLIGRSGPFIDPRHDLDPQNREVVLAQLAREFVRVRRGAVSQPEAISFISAYLESRDWPESASATLEAFRKMRLLRVEGNTVQFQQTSYLHLFAAKAAVRDTEFLAEMLNDPLYFAPILRHYAALVRDSESVLDTVNDLLQSWMPADVEGRFYGVMKRKEVEEEEGEEESAETDGAEVDSGDDEEVASEAEEPAAELPESFEYDESSDADRVPFPLSDPLSWPEQARLATGLELASRVLRDSDDVANLELKSELFKVVLSRWGYLAQVSEVAGTFDDLSLEITNSLIEAKVLQADDRDAFARHFSMSLMGFSLFRALMATLASRKLLRTYERVSKELNVRDDPHVALSMTLFAMSVRGAGWTEELEHLLERHGDRWSTVQFVGMLVRMSWASQRLSPADETALRGFLKGAYQRRFKFPNERTKKIRTKRFDNRLTEERNSLKAAIRRGEIG